MTRTNRSVTRMADELATLSPEAAVRRIATESRFHSRQVARRLTELSIAALLERPEDSARRAETALVVLDHMPSGAGYDSDYVRAYCALSNARRLMGDLIDARAQLDEAAPFVTLKEDSALHLRSYALLRWEQGRCDEAAGLMIRAERLFRDSALDREASETCHLLILFYSEMGETADALELYRSLTPMDDPSVRPWLGSRTSLSAAFLLAHRPDLASPAEALAALGLGSSLISLVRDPDELLRLEWLQARALARMGHHEEAGTLLSLRKCLCPPGIRDLHFHLLTLDLFAIRVTAGQDVEDLLQDLDNTPPSIPELQPLTDPLRLWLAGDRLDPWGMASSLQRLLRRTFRAKRLPVDLLPFA